MTARMTVTLPDDIYQQINDWSEKLGVSKTQLASMAIQAGLGAIIRAVKPEEAISPEFMAKIVEAMQKLGPEVEELKGK